MYPYGLVFMPNFNIAPLYPLERSQIQINLHGNRGRKAGRKIKERMRKILTIIGNGSRAKNTRYLHKDKAKADTKQRPRTLSYVNLSKSQN